MVDYDHVRDQACLSFISSKGLPLSIWIHRSTWENLMGSWDEVKLGEQTLHQKELRTAARSVLKRDFAAWFDKNSNEFMQRKANQGRE
jgi:hypothetical protein